MLAKTGGLDEPRTTLNDLGAYELLYVPVLAIDTGFNIIFINEKACEITGYSKEEIRDKGLFDLASPGELKKKLLRLFQGQVFEPDFTVRSSLVTRCGRVRDVEWQCRTMYQGIVRAGAVITFVDLTGPEVVLNLAGIVSGSNGLEEIVCRFMDLLSDPLNLKLARASLRTHAQALTFVRAYPHGGVRKKPWHALRDSRNARGALAEARTFSMKSEGAVIGELELIPYGDSPLTAEDELYVNRLCGILSASVSRLLQAAPQGDARPVSPESTAFPVRQKGSDRAAADTVKYADVTQQLMGMLPQGVIVCDRDGRVTSVNESAARILGTATGELEGQAIAEVARRLAPERKRPAASGIRSLPICRALRTGTPVMNARSEILVNGSRRSIETSVVPLPDDSDGIAGCVATIRDVTVIASIIRLGRMALNGMNVADLVEESMDMIMNTPGLRLVSLYLCEGGELKLRVQKGEHSGMPLPECRDMPDPLNPTLQSRAFLGKKPLLIKDYRRCASVRLFDPLARKRPVQSMAGIPLRTDRGVIGVLVAATGTGHAMDEAQLADLSAICCQLAAALEGVSPRSPAD